jgi:putative cell wall-binding protein
MPEEIATVHVVQPAGLAVLTGDDFIYSTIASASSMGNGTDDFDIITTAPDRILDSDLERLQEYSEIIILGNESIVSNLAESRLEGSSIIRIGGECLYEQCLMYAAEIWSDGVSEVVLSSSSPADLFRAYQQSQISGCPLVICQGGSTEKAEQAIEEMAGRNITLIKALYIGEIDEEYLKPLEDSGIETEEVRA